LLPDLCNRAVQQGELVAFASELLSVRRHLAQAVLERIPAPITAALAAPFEAAIDRLQRQIDVDGDFNEIVSADLEVAQALIAASGSSVLGLLFNPISATLRRDPQLRMALYQRPLENLRAWRAMFAWCASDDRDTAGILDAMRLRDEQLIRRLKDQNLFDSAARQAADELILQGVEQS
jgi:DNA-binding FadR family transcriptional regulator